MSRTHVIGKGCEGNERMLEAIDVSHQYSVSAKEIPIRY
jgi:hypothetical protein